LTARKKSLTQRRKAAKKTEVKGKKGGDSRLPPGLLLFLSLLLPLASSVFLCGFAPLREALLRSEKILEQTGLVVPIGSAGGSEVYEASPCRAGD
jgi:hypothetical protein